MPVQVQSGRHRHLVEIRRVSDDEMLSPSGAPVQVAGDAGVLVCKTYCEIRPATGQEYWAASVRQDISRMSHWLEMRHRDGLHAKMRVWWPLWGRAFDILYVQPVLERRRRLILVLEEVY